MAAGLSLPMENVDVLRKRLNDECSLTEDELIQRYGQVLVQYQPYFVLSSDIGNVFYEYWKNEKNII